jgi:hypothetical protein
VWPGRSPEYAIGVGHLRASPTSVWFPRANTPELRSLSATIGVGQALTASSSIVPECITPVVVVCLAELRESATVAVGHDEDSGALVRGTNGGRS